MARPVPRGGEGPRNCYRSGRCRCSRNDISGIPRTYDTSSAVLAAVGARSVVILGVAARALDHHALLLTAGLIPYSGSGSFIFSQMAMNLGSPKSRSRYLAGVVM